MVRRRLTIKRIDPWSVLKFGAVANVALFAMFLLAMGVVWFIVDRLELVEQICGIATDVGFTACGVNGGNLFRAIVLLGLLWVVIQTAVLVFFAFLHNLIADLTGGLVVGVADDTVGPQQPRGRMVTRSTPTSSIGEVGAPAGANDVPPQPQPVRRGRPAPRDLEGDELFGPR